MFLITLGTAELVEITIIIAIATILSIFLMHRNRLRKKKNAIKVGDINLKSSLSMQEMNQKMIQLAKHHQIKLRRRNLAIKHLKTYAYQDLRAIRRKLSGVSTDIISLIPAARWLYDNFYILLREIERSSQRNDIYHNLPVITAGEFKDYPRIYAIAYEMTTISGAKLNEDIVTEMLKAYCGVEPLTSMELWAFQDVLGLCLLQGVLYTSEDILCVTNKKTIADKFIKKQMEGNLGEELDLLNESNRSISDVLKKDNVFLSHVYYLLKNMSIEDGRINEYMTGLTSPRDTPFKPSSTFLEESRFEVGLESIIRTFIVSLRSINDINIEEMFENISTVHNILKNDPAGIYEKMNFETRNRYRNVIEKLALKTKVPEWKVAKKVVEIANELKSNDAVHVPDHVGTYLVHKGSRMILGYIKGKGIDLARYSRKSKKGMCYFVLISLMTFALASLLCYWIYRLGYNPLDYRAVLFYLFSLFPVMGIVIELVNFVFMRAVPSRMMPSMDFEKSIPDESRTFVVMPVIVSSADKAIQYVDRLEKYYWANMQNNLYFALLMDLPDAPQRVMPVDEEIVATAIKGIHALNERYPGDNPLFSLFVRYRKWNKAEDCFMGWERKRGKLEEFNALLCGDPTTSFELMEGSEDILDSFKYIITIDSDTDLIRGSAHKFVGIISHPLNKPVVDETNRVKEGYAIIQSEIRNHIATLRNCVFSKTFAQQVGINNYSTVVSDVYQDTFEQGTFVGKGIYDLHVMNQILRNALPENSVLSHDLLESCYVKCAFSSNVTLMDSYPSSVASYIKREHRWIRGDWQLLPWIFKRKLIDSLGKWKIFDNIRRSVIPICIIFIILINAYYMPRHWYIWIPLVFFGDAFHVIKSVLKVLKKTISNSKSTLIVKQFAKRIYKIAEHGVFVFILMPYRAWIALDAIIRTLYRLIFTKKKLLQWQSSEWVDDNLKSTPFVYVKAMLSNIIPIGVLVFIINISDMAKPALIVYSAIAFIWLISPLISFVISHSFEKDQSYRVRAEDKNDLRMIARRTWQFFSDYSTEKTHWLCPDNYQLTPISKVTDKTSPTNIGLQILSMLSARDMGFLGLTKFLNSVENIINTVDLLPKWYGHLYNWYQLSTFTVLEPKYISTVDSGNFVGSLLDLKSALQSIKDKEVLSKSAILGIKDDLSLCEMDFEMQDDYDSIDDFLSDLRKISDKTEENIKPWENENWVGRLGEDCKGFFQDVEYFRIAEGLFDEQKTLSELAAEGLAAARDTIRRLDELSKIIDNIVERTDFTKLYDTRCRLFYIGYHASSRTVDAGHYDLMASECSLTSFLAIAKGDIPQKHWYKLARPVTMVSGTPVLVSWSGTMFEYLMPNLVMRHSPGSVFSHSSKFAVVAQQKFAKKSERAINETKQKSTEKVKIPWGISESQYFSFDINSNYQYKAFGVPDLQLQPRTSNMIVVAPYASLLAINLSTAKTMKNIKLLKEMNALGEYGFYEAVDFSSPDSFRLKDYSIVKSFMAHHQGMILVSINNFLNNNIIRKRFHSNPMVKATEVLLEETRGNDVIVTVGKNYKIDYKQIKILPEKTENRYINSVAVPAVKAHWLSNSYYSLLLTSDGDGFSRYEDIIVNRWRPDTSTSAGQYIYLRDVEEKKYWSAAYKPTLIVPDEYKVVFSHNQAEFTRRDGDIVTTTTVTLSAVRNYEIRNVTITNNSTKDKDIEVTSYMETVLDKYLNELYHPAFNKLFLESEFDPEHDMLICKRRKHSDMQEQPLLFHMVKTDAITQKSIEYETSRLEFIGRTNTVACPDAILEGIPLSNKAKFSTDPIFSLRETVRVPEGKTVSLAFVTGICFSKEEACTISESLNTPLSINDVFGQFKLNSELEIRYLNITVPKVNTFQDLIAPIFYPDITFRGPENMIAQNWKNQSFLWRFGVSGDNPVMLLLTKSVEHIGIVREVLKAYEYYQVNKIDVDLIILIQGQEGYTQELASTLAEMTSALKVYDTKTDKPSLFVLYESRMEKAEINLLFTVACIVFDENTGIHFRIPLEEAEEKYKNLQIAKPYKKMERQYIPIINGMDQGKHLEFFNSFGGFTRDGKEYEILLTPHNKTPMPWINVISNDSYGFHVSETGAGYTWAVNSHENKITSWTNDPVTNPITEGVFLRDNKTGEVSSPAALGRIQKGFYKVRHGFGYSVFEHEDLGISQTMTMFVSLDEPVKLWKLELINNEDVAKDLRVAQYAEWVLGLDRALTAPYIVTEFDDVNKYLWSKCVYNYEFRKHHAFMFSSEKIVAYSGDRKEFLGINGMPKKPMGMKTQASGKVGAGLDPCGVIAIDIVLEPHEKKEIVFGLGQSPDEGKIVEIVNKYRKLENVDSLLGEIAVYWDRILTQTQVKTENRALDIMTNGWLLYQTISCRLKARAAFYQCGGAYGYRDQLQDVLSLLDTDPDRVRRQIIIACSHQFDEGDVQHWWHPPQGLGVRTRISDDLLWLPYVTASYIKHTGDYMVLNENVTGIKGPQLKKTENDIMFIPQPSEEKISVYEHCKKAIDHVGYGIHGLPLMGGGDWNDGMNMIGLKGRGESVWLGWFVYAVLTQFAPICKYKKDDKTYEKYHAKAVELQQSIEKNAWDGEWYSRAYYDNGDKLGTKDNDECRIDSISQSWSVISGGASTARKFQSLFSAKRFLVKPEESISLLLTPPFDKTKNNPGYIKDYYPGIRENGGQYTHAAVWLAIANALVKDGETANNLLDMLNPIQIASTQKGAMRYEKEPYAVVADISMNDMFAGKGGWSWYTGSAGWLYQAYLRYFLGIQRRGDKMTIDPAIPQGFGDYQVKYKFGESLYTINVKRGTDPDAAISCIYRDGEKSEGNSFALIDDGKNHSVEAVGEVLMED